MLDSAGSGHDRVSDKGIRSVCCLVADSHPRHSAFDSLGGYIYAGVWGLVDSTCSVQCASLSGHLGLFPRRVRPLIYQMA